MEFHAVKLKPARAPAAAPSREYHVRAVDRVIAILDELAAGPEEKGDVALSEKLGLHKSTVHRLLAVLARRGLVERKAGAAKYTLGWRVFELGMAAASQLDILDRSRPYVARLVELTGETAHLGILRQDAVVSLVNVESRHTVRTPATVGRRIPLHCTSQGKALLAFLPPDALERRLKGHKFTAHARNTITNRAQFLAELSSIADRGYAVDNEEFEAGLRCVAAPVRDHTGCVIAAISIAGPSFRVTMARLPQFSRDVMRVAGDLSAALGYESAKRVRNSRPEIGRES